MHSSASATGTALPRPGLEASPPRMQRWMLAVLPAALLLLIAGPWRYDAGLAERDLVRMMAALVYSAHNGYVPMMYGLKFSFGYYALLHLLAPQGTFATAQSAAQFMNLFGLASGVALALTCTACLRIVFGARTGLAAAVIFCLSPLMLFSGLSGHPIIPAAACLFAATALLARLDAGSAALKGSRAGLAFVLCLAGLCLRAEVLLGFAFALVAHAPGTRALYGRKALLLGAAFGVYLAMQSRYVSESGGAAANIAAFVRSFVAVEHMARGGLVFALATGMITLGVACAALLRARPNAAHFVAALTLGVPALAFWLPNPQPARHFLFAAAAAAVLAAFALAHRYRRHLVLATLVLVSANQLVAEAMRAAIAPRYQWTYPATGHRRATPQLPLGLFALDQRANQAQADDERREAAALAAQAPPRLLVLGDSVHYVMAELVAADHALQWSASRWNGVQLGELRSGQRHIVLIEKATYWPRDLAAEVLADHRWDGWQVYVQPSTISRYDVASVPPERLYRPNR